MGKISALGSQTAPADADLLVTVDVSDTTMASTGTDKQLTLAALKTYVGTGFSDPMTTEGDLIIEDATPAPARLAVGAAGDVLTVVSGLPAWSAPAVSAVPVTVAEGGTGQVTQQAALNALAGAVTAGEVLAGDGADVTLRSLAAADLLAAMTATFTFGSSGAAPSSGTYAAGNVLADQNGVLRICTAAGTPGTWARVFADPWQFFPEDYGARGDGQIVTDGAMTSGSAVLTCATSAPFTSADVGKYVLVWAAATASTWLFATITAYTSASQVTLSASAGNTVTASGVFYATDDTAAWQQALDAARARTLQGDGKTGTVVAQDRMYGIASAPPAAGTNAGNAQVYLTPVPATSGPKAQVEIRGTGCAQPPHWTQPQPDQSGTILVGMRTDGALDTTYGPASVIGGPVSGYGSNGTFSNMHLRTAGVTVMVPASPGAYCGLNLQGLGQASVDSYSYLPLAVVPSSATWPQVSSAFSSVPGYSYGLRMPAVLNNAVADIGEYACYFAQVALVAGEHCTWRTMKTVYCAFGLLPASNSGSSGAVHGIHGSYWTCENVTYPIATLASGYFEMLDPVSVSISHLSLETYTAIVSDAAGKLQGTVVFEDLSAPGRLFTTRYSGSSDLKLIYADGIPGLAASPPAVPLSDTAQLNGYYRDATVIIDGGTVTAVALDGTTLAGVTSGPVRVPSGHSITLTYSAAPTWQWILD